MSTGHVQFEWTGSVESEAGIAYYLLRDGYEIKVSLPSLAMAREIHQQLELSHKLAQREARKKMTLEFMKALEKHNETV